MKCIFQLSFNVRDLDVARKFCSGVLGCTEGRSADTWVDFDFLATSCHCTWVSLSKRR